LSIICNTEALTQVWNENPDLIKKYLEEYANYQLLCREIAYILEKELKKAGIEFSAVTNRVKSLESFAEKIFRKKYEDPLKGITDIAGTRVVYLYRNDFKAIEKILRSAFEVIEKVDKIADQGVDRFGYGAIHFLLKLGKTSSGARYDDLKNYVCELQVRTVLQDAWAVIDHHLVYKHESGIPSKLKRKLNAMAGSFELADSQFDNIRTERESYLKKIKKMRVSKQLLGQEINYDTVNTYLQQRFPRNLNSPTTTHYILQRLRRAKFKKISNLHHALSKTEKARLAYINHLGEKDRLTAQGELFIALVFDDAQSCLEGKAPWDDLPDNITALIRKYSHLIK
jgi:ppGpp synthetase/RelA/SpoT-type nucleotidyltranferase